LLKKKNLLLELISKLHAKLRVDSFRKNAFPNISEESLIIRHGSVPYRSLFLLSISSFLEKASINVAVIIRFSQENRKKKNRILMMISYGHRFSYSAKNAAI
jgi:hypothetical protein